METQTLAATPRTKLGTNHTRRLRDEGLIPGVIYGHGEPPVAFAINRHDLEVELLHGHRLLSLNLEGHTSPYLVKDVQYDHLGSEPLHIDLARVDLNEMVTVEVAIELRGTPKGATEGGVLEQVLNELEVECRATEIPGTIKANVAHLEANQVLTVGDLQLPPGVRATQDPEDTVAVVRFVAEEVEAEETEEAASSEPEVISRGKAEDEQAGQA